LLPFHECHAEIILADRLDSRAGRARPGTIGRFRPDGTFPILAGACES
jgi:hypothetical protein